MGRKKNSNTSQSSEKNNDTNQNQNTKIRFEASDDLEEPAMSSSPEESAVVSDKITEDVSMCDADASFIDGDDDKTSADYYFDSYSHFGIFLSAKWLKICWNLNIFRFWKSFSSFFKWNLV